MIKLEKLLIKIKQASYELSCLNQERISRILLTISSNVSINRREILIANQQDIESAQRRNLSKAVVNRLRVTDRTIDEMIKRITTIANTSDHVGSVLTERKLENGALLRKIAVPFGVIGVIYESRPNVTIDAAALCLKSRNAVLLKGGSEALNSNRVLHLLIVRSLAECGLDTHTVSFLDTNDRKVVLDVLSQNEFLDLIIPRGGYSLIRTIKEHSTIPVLYHAAGGARIYVDQSANSELAVRVVMNAKVSNPAACNSLDTLLVHQDIAPVLIPKIVAEYRSLGVEVRGDSIVRQLSQVSEVTPASEKDWSKEYLDLVVSVKIVKNSREAIRFVRRYSKRHSEGIIAEDRKVIDDYLSAVDAAALFINCSTRLHDGSVFGMGAEMGISTGKLQARGPVGLSELSTYKWIMYGNGQVRD